MSVPIANCKINNGDYHSQSTSYTKGHPEFRNEHQARKESMPCEMSPKPLFSQTESWVKIKPCTKILLHSLGKTSDILSKDQQLIIHIKL